jgi:hypothetical protein
MEVTQRWLYLHESLRTLASQTSLKDDFLSYMDGIGWQSRITRQLEPIHWVAYHLDPAGVPGKVDESSRYHMKVFYGLFKTKIKARLLGTNFCRFGRRQVHFIMLLAGRLTVHLSFGLKP